MRIAVIGTGYVGLTTGACLAELGNEVTCDDIDSRKIAALRRFECPIFEPGLQELIAANARAGRLSFTERLDAVTGADLVFLAVNTPSDAKGRIDLSYVEAAARSVAPLLGPQSVLVLKSTVIAGTAARIATMLRGQSRRAHVRIASNPEFLREGSAIDDFMNPDRVVIGTDDEAAARMLTALFEPLTAKGVPLVATTPTNAELIKYAANAFLALKIGFINNVADLCESVEGTIEDVARGIGLDRRIGSAFLTPGPGFGGSCFPKDTRAFASSARAADAPQVLVDTLIQDNEDRKERLASRILSALGPSPAGARVAVLGTAFKANTDDMRESAALTIVPYLQRAGISIAAHDPKAREAGRSLLPQVEWHDDPFAAAQQADAVVILTEWEEYRALDLERLGRVMRGRHLFDYRNLFAPEAVGRHDLHYISLGRPPAYVSPEAGEPAMVALSAAAE